MVVGIEDIGGNAMQKGFGLNLGTTMSSMQSGQVKKGN